jgi:hypothetical protein
MPGLMTRNVVGLTIVVFALVTTGHSQSSTSVSGLLATERWIGLAGYPGGISLRTASGDLLLKHNNAEVVYAFSQADNRLRSVRVDDWNNASGEVVDCNRQVQKGSVRIRIDRETNKLIVNEKVVNGIRGNVHLRYQFTSEGDRFAILSAGGTRASSLLPFLGQGGASGTHYNQIFSYPGLAPIGPTVELPFTTERVTFRSCWSADERFIVYSDAIDSQLSVVIVR